MQDSITKDLEKELSGCAQLHVFLENHRENMKEHSISDLLRIHMAEKNLSRADVITASGLNDIYAHQIFAGKRNPSREKLLCICFGMGLTADQTQELLRDCGYVPLYVKKRRDSIILYALMHGLTLLQSNELLYEEKEDLLS